MLRITPFAVPLALAACGGGGEDDELRLDIRVDHAGPDGEGIESLAPKTCLGGGQNIYVVWYDDRGGESAIWYNRSRDGGVSWLTTDVQINRPDEGGAALNPDIACSGEFVYVAWQDERDGDLKNENIYYSWSNDGGESWQATDTNIDQDPEGETISLEPRIAAAGDVVYVVWIDSRNGAFDILFNMSADNGVTWLSEPRRIDADDEGESFSSNPRFAVDGEGLIVVAWEDLRNGWSDIYINRSTDHGLSWGATDKRLDVIEGVDSVEPRIAESEGHVYVAWTDKPVDGPRDIYVTHSSNRGGSWPDDPTSMESAPPGLYDARSPAISARGAELHAVWQDDRANGYDIFYRHSADGAAGWTGEEVRLDRDDAGIAQSYDPIVQAWDDGAVVVVWADRRNDSAGAGFNDLFYNYSMDFGQTWDDVDHRINASAKGTAYANQPWLGRAPDGDVGWSDRLFFSWSDGRYGSADVFFHTLLIGESSPEFESDGSAGSGTTTGG